MDAEQALPTRPTRRSARGKGHLERIRELARVQHWKLRGEIGQPRFGAYAAEAELWLARPSGRRRETGKAPAAGTGTLEGRGKDAKSQMILAKLDEPISMSFNEDTPLEDVLKYIKQATTTHDLPGHPDLRRSRRPARSREVHDVDRQEHGSRRRAAPPTLQLLLKQLDLIYFVEDGMLYITSAESESPWAVRTGDALNHRPSCRRPRKPSAARFAVGNEGTDRAFQNPRADHEARIGSREPEGLRQRAWGAGMTKRPKSEPMRPEADREAERRTKPRVETNAEQIGELLKEMRELIEVLKASGRKTEPGPRRSELSFPKRRPGAVLHQDRGYTGSMTTCSLHRADLVRLDGTGVPDHGVGDRATDGMTKQRLGLEPVEPAVDQAGQERVARADRIDDVDLGRDRSIPPASIQDRDRVGPVGDNAADHPAPVPVCSKPAISSSVTLVFRRRMAASRRLSWIAVGQKPQMPSRAGP